MATEESRARLSGIRAVAIDLDGVVYEGARLLPGADRAVAVPRASAGRVQASVRLPRTAAAGAGSTETDSARADTTAAFGLATSTGGTTT